MTKKPASKFRLEALEPRLLFSAEAVAPPPEAAAPAGGIESVLESPLLPETEGSQDAQSNEQLRRELVFIDAGVSNYQQLLEDILEQKDAGRKIEAVVLDSNKDGVEQISNYLSRQQNVDTLHVVSHGGNGVVKLGNVLLTSETLDSYADSIEGWQQALTQKADLLLYGCNLAQKETGIGLLDNLALITGADVAASDDLTGASKTNGDWLLEYKKGSIESTVAFSAEAQQDWAGSLASIIVNTVNDLNDGGNTSSIANLISTPGTDGISLREAIIAANNTAGDDTIILAPGTYTLTQSSAVLPEDFAATGDLDITDTTGTLTITGSDAATTTIDASGMSGVEDRVFEITLNAHLIVSGVTVTGGDGVSKGGAFRVSSTGQLNLTETIVSGNKADHGAGIFNDGTVTATDTLFDSNIGTPAANSSGGAIETTNILNLNRVTISNNTAESGGGIYVANSSNSALLTNVTISGNTATGAPGEGGGLWTRAPVTLVNSTIASNTAVDGGGIFNDDTGPDVTITNTLIADNTATVNPDIFGGVTSDGSNLVETINANTYGFVPGDITGVDPLLASLADNGGFTETHELLFGSQAINGGTVTGAPATDQRGMSRDDGVPDIGAYEEVPVNGLWLSTTGDLGVPSGAPGLDTWEDGHILAFDPTSLGVGTTSGTFKPRFFIENFATDTSIVGMHYVTTNISVGGANAVALQPGDLLFSIDKTSWLSSNNALWGFKEDVILFRPDTPRDYSQGTFTRLLINPLAKEIEGLTLIEEPTLVGDTTVQAGDFLFVSKNSPDIRLYEVNDVGLSTSGTDSLFILGADVGVDQAIFGIDLIESPVSLAGTNLLAGEMLVTLKSTDTQVGGNKIPVSEYDIFSLNITKTNYASASAKADATLFFQGGNVGLDLPAEALSALTLAELPQTSAPPSITVTAGPLNYTPGDPATIIDATATVTDSDSADFDTGKLTVYFGTGGSADDRLTINNEGTNPGQISIQASNVKYGGNTIGTFSGGTDGSTPLVITLNAIADEPAVQALVRNITYENISPTPTPDLREVRFTLSDGDGGTSNVETATINILTPNTAPTAADNAINIVEDPVSPYTFVASDFNFADGDGDTLSQIQITSLETVGILTFNGSDVPLNLVITKAQIDAGLLKYQPQPDGNGSPYDSFKFKVHDGIEYSAAAYTMDMNVSAQNDPPSLVNTTLPLNQGQTVTLTNGMLSATDIDTAATALTMTVTNVNGGHFALAIETLTPITSFTQQQINDGDIVFVDDGDPVAPSFDVEVSDGEFTAGPVAASVRFVRDALWLSTSQDVTGSGVTGLNGWSNGAVLEMSDPGFSLEPGTTAGTFSQVFDIKNFANDAGTELTALHVVASYIVIDAANSITLQEGDVLFAVNGAQPALSSSNTVNTVGKGDVVRFRPDTAGDYSTGTFEIVLENPLLENIGGISLVEKDTWIGDRWVYAGDFLLVEIKNFDNDKLIQHYTVTSAGAGTTVGSAQVLVDGRDLNIGTADLSSIHLVSDATEIGGASLSAGNILVSLDKAKTLIDPFAGIDVAPQDIIALNITATGTGTTAATATRIFEGLDVSLDTGAEAIEAFSLLSVDQTTTNATPSLVEKTLTINEGETLTLGSSMLSATDADNADASLVFDITGVTGGYFAYSADTATPITSFAQSDITSGSVVFVHDGNEVAPSFNVSVGDGSSSSVPMAAIINFTNVNDAPVLDNSGSMTLANMVENNTNPPGNSVATIISIAGGDRITDADSAAFEGIAVIGVDNSNGTWEYSLNGGSTWVSFVASGVSNGMTDDTAAVLLDPTALIRFVPAPGYTGTAGNITFRAWDQTDSLASGTASVDVSGNGNATAYSTATETATLTVVPKGGVINLLPAGQNVEEDTALVFSVAGGNSITVDDGSATDNVLRTTLSVSNGTLTLATLTGLTIESGANGTSTITVVGLESAINAALEGLTYDPAGHYNGADSLQVSTDLLADIEGYYTFDNPADPGKDDSASGANDATVTGATPVVDVDRGNVLSFDGNDSVRITGRFGDPANVTLAAWVDLNGVQTKDELISLGDNVAIRLNEGGAAGVQGFFYDGSTWRHTSSGSFLDSTGWHHVAYTFDDATNTQVLYIDGVAVATTNYSASISYTLGADTYLGRNGNAAQAYLHGSLDDARIYSRALSAEEIAILFQDQASHSANVAISVAPVGDTPQVANIPTDEDTQSGLIVINRHASDGAEVTHFRISGISGGTLYQADGVTQINDGDYITFAEGQAGLRFTPTANSNTAGTFNVESSEDGSTVAAQSGIATSTITVTPVGDTPIVTNITTDEDTQSGLIVVNRHAADNAEVTHFRISAITGGTLYQADGVTQINNGAYITFAEGQAGLRFTPTANSNNSGSFNVESSEDGTSVAAQSGAATSTITVTPVGDTPSVANTTTDEDTQSGLIIVNRHAADGAEVTHFRISGITDGTLYQADGVTQINNGDYITFAEGQAGLRFTPTANSNNPGSFKVESSEDGSSVAAQSGAATSTITVTPVGDTPTVADITTDEDTQSGLIVIARHTADGAEVTHFRISGITGGTLFQADGLTQINNGDYITFAEGQAGLRFTPTANSNNSGSFNVESSEDGTSVAAQSGAATSTITVTPVGDTPTVADITTDEDTQSGLIVINRHAADGAEVTHFHISGITGGTLYQADGLTQINDGDYITFAEGQAGLRFTPAANGNAAGSFNVESSEDGSSAAAQSGIATSTITVTPVGDTPAVANITTDEDTQSGLIVINRHASDGAEVTHFRISGISGGTLYQADGVTQINNGDYITFAEGQAGLRFTPTANINAAGSFNVESSEDGSSVAAQSGAATSTITVTPVGDTPTVANITTDEDTQSGLIVIDRHAADGAEVTHFRISGISGGILFHSDGITQINDGDYITFAEGQAGLRFTPTANSNAAGSFNVESSEDGTSVAAQSGAVTSTITVTPVGDTPQVANITTDEDTQSGLIVINRHSADGAEVTHFRISGISGGTLYQADGVTQINNGDYITFAEGQAGLRFTPTANSNAAGAFNVEASEDGATVAAQSGGAASTITVTPVGDTPTVANITTDEDTQSGLIVVNRHAADGAEVTHFRISGISGGTLYQADGVTQINDGDFITFAEGQAGLRFTPTANSNAAGSFNVEASEDGTSVAAQSGAATSTITVTPVGDTPTVVNITTDEDTQSGLIVIDRHAADGAEVTHFRISGITGGILFHSDGVTQINDGNYITFAEGQAGLRFTPTANSNAAGAFNVEASEDGATVAAQSGGAASTITVTPVGDTPTVANITTDEDTQSGLIVVNRHAADGAEVTHFRISGITGGTLFHSDGITQINDGDFITFAEGQAGVRFTPLPNSTADGTFNVEASEDGVSVAAQSGAATSTITVTSVGDPPQVADITTDEDTQSGLIVIDRNATDGPEVTHFRISNISGGTLYQADGVTQINDGDYITFAQGQAGVRFTPSADSTAAGSFDVESSEDGSTVAAQSNPATSTITVTPVGDTPTVANISTDEDTQSGLIVVNRHAADGAEVTHFRISGITGGILFHSDGITQINDGDYITFAQGQAGLRFTPTANRNAAGAFNVEASEDGATVAAQSEATASTITVTPVGDTPTVANITTDEDTQSGLIVIKRHAADGAEVTHFRISGITAGTLHQADGVTQINDGDYITFAQAQAGLRFTPAANSNAAGSFNVESSENGSSVAAQSGVVTSTITVIPVGDTPQVGNISTDEDTQSGLIVIDRHAADGAEVTHFRISGVTGGILFHSDGITQINDGDYITFAEGQAGLRFTPTANSNAAGSFNVESSEDGVSVAAQSGASTSTITVTPVGDTPTVANITTDEDTQSGLIVIKRHAADGAEVAHFRISGITGGTLFHSDGITRINDGDYITFAQGQAGLRFTPTADSNAAGSFNVEASEDGTSVAAQSGAVTSTITVTPVGDTPQVANITTEEDTQSGLIVIDRHAADSAEVTHFRISGIIGGTLFHSDGITQINDGDYITFAQGQAGLRFTPTADSNAAGFFNVEASEDGTSVAAQSGAATSTITVTPVGDTPTVANVTTDEDSQSGLIVIDRHAADGAEVTHFRISGITGGSLFLANGVTQINDGDYITFAQGQAGLRFTPSANSNLAGSFNVEASEDGTSVAAQSEAVTSTITVTPVGDTPQVANITTDEDTQSGLIVIDRHAADGAEVTHFRISDITGGTLYHSDGVTQIHDGDYISFGQGQDGLRFTPSADSNIAGSFKVEASEDGVDVAAQSAAATSTIRVTPVNDTPVTGEDGLTTLEDNALAITSITDLLVNDTDIDGDQLVISSFTQPSHGSLVDNGDGTLTYTPDEDFNGHDSFTYTVSDGQGDFAIGTAIIIVTPEADTPQVSNVTTLAGLQSGLITINPHKNDGPEVTHFKISGITGGTLYMANGVTQVNNGDFITRAQAQAGLRFTPTSGSADDGHFNVEASLDGQSVSAKGAVATATVKVTTPIEKEQTQEEEKQEPVKEQPTEDEAASEALAPEKPEALPQPAGEPEGLMKLAEDEKKNSARDIQQARIPKPLLDNSSYTFDQTPLLIQEERPTEESGLSFIVKLQNAWEALDIEALSAETYEHLRDSLDAFKTETAEEMLLNRAAVGSAIVTSMGLSAGYVVWLLKGGSLLASVLSSMPAWQLTDPLSILASTRGREDDEESLESIIEDGSKKSDDQKKEDSEANKD